jgi:hypothetical protein
MNNQTETPNKFDPRNGFTHTPERQAIIRFEVAAWALRSRDHYKCLEARHITEYEQAREALQDMGWTEDGLDDMECQHVRMQAASFNLHIQGMNEGKLPPVMVWEGGL